ncbi:MAG: protein phosphatase 2C domain-containing protein [Blautia sp.]|nr:protein phosphatase 2C domain-containing protein [Lachnoclostridium sp.]MCM1212302.1 protein phosphatase 2C domain-containing protein [Blautia sp.]
MKLDVYMFTNNGGREYNEDFADYRIDDAQAFFILADGLGGHFGGEIASHCIVENLTASWETDKEKISRVDWLEKNILRANDTLIELQKEKKGKMKSTVVTLCLDAGMASWAHVGDSRLYYLSEGRIMRLTADHSVTYKKYKSGKISRDGMNFDEDRSSLLRVMGDEGHCNPECGCLDAERSVMPGDAFLLCSDGFWEYLYDEEILVDCLKSDTASRWGEQMLIRAMNRMKPDSDNLTFIAVMVQ